jgi:hypothetical protein
LFISLCIRGVHSFSRIIVLLLGGGGGTTVAGDMGEARCKLTVTLGAAGVPPPGGVHFGSHAAIFGLQVRLQKFVCVGRNCFCTADPLAATTMAVISSAPSSGTDAFELFGIQRFERFY